MRRLLPLLLGILLFAATAALAQSDWTVMVYLAADNDLEDCAIDDFLEMAQVGSNDDLKIVVLLDRTPGYDDRYNNWTDTRRGLVMAGDTPGSTWGTSLGEKNTGAAATVSEFANWAMATYPATRYAFIFWNHGNGWRTQALAALRELRAAADPAARAAAADRLRSLAGVAFAESEPADETELLAAIARRVKAVCWDDSSGGDALTVKEVQQAIAAFTDTIDLVGFDACLMGMIEVGYQLRNSGAEVMVASEETIPGEGWPYHTLLDDLKNDSTATAEAFGTYIVDRYYASVGNDLTLSAVALDEYGSLGGLVDTLATTLINSWNTDEAAVRDAAQDVLDELDIAILCNRSGAGGYAGAFGVSISFPATGSETGYTAANLDFVANTAWGDFLNAYAANMGGSWIAIVRAATQIFDDDTYLDLYDFCRKLVNYHPPQQGYTETRESTTGLLGGGVAQGWRDDDHCWQYNLPFSFSFYGVEYTQVYVCSNGYLDFANATADFDDSTSRLLNQVRIAPLWQDLDTSEGDIYIHQPDADSVCIRWAAREYRDGGGGDPVNMEVILYRDGNIRFRYGTGNTTLSPTVGLSAGNGWLYDVSGFYNGIATLTNARSLLFTPRDLTPRLTYTPEAFNEAAANNGAIGNAILIDLLYESFTAEVVSGGFVSADNVPAGLTAVFTRNTATRITMTLTGQALNHYAADSIADLTVIFDDGAFVGGDAAAVTDSTKDDLQVNFNDPVYTVRFKTSGSGVIQGQATQQVTEGGNCSQVSAVPALGHHFTGWTGDIPAGLENTNPLTITNVMADMTITANFAVDTFVLTFIAGDHGTVNGAAVFTEVVTYGANSSNVRAIPDPDAVFDGWIGDYIGYDNPLAFTYVTAPKTVTANFVDISGSPQLTCGSIFTVNEAEVPGLDQFNTKPKLWGVYYDPIKDLARTKPKKAGAGVLTKLLPVTTIQAEWKKAVCLYDKKAFLGEQKVGTFAAVWLAAHPISPLLVAQWLATKELAAGAVNYRRDALMPPEITGVTDNHDGTMTVTGKWFGNKLPKLWREYRDAKGAVKQQKLKVLAPADPGLVNAKGKMCCMDALTGASKLIVVIPDTLPPGTSSGKLVLDNGIGLATWNDPSQSG